MKPILLTAAFLFILMGNTTTFASEVDTVKTCSIPSEIRKALVKQINFPDEARKLHVEGKVAACFSISPQGKLHINCINGHPVLTRYVKNRMESFECSLPNSNLINRPMFIRFNFEIEHL